MFDHVRQGVRLKGVKLPKAGGVFIFLTCTINVFIAVLSDCYDQEQERMAPRWTHLRTDLGG